MSFYKSPPEGYDFKQNADYWLIVSNSKGEDENLLRLVENTHYDICYIFKERNQFIPLIVNGVNVKHSVNLEKIKFNKIDEVIEFIKKESKTNFFFLYSFLNLELEFCTLSMDNNVDGLKDYKRDRLLSEMGIND